MRRLLSIVCCVWLLSAAVWGANSTQGTDFWVTYLRNLRAGDCSLIAAAPTDATITVTNPLTHWTTSFTVPAGETAVCNVPRAQAYNTADGTTDSKGLHVTSTAPIALYASNYADGTYDATLVLPFPALGLEYIIQTYEDKQEAAEFALVATRDNTSVTITPHARTQDGHVKNVAYTITLHAGQTYQVFCDDPASDFSGTYIRSDKPVAVFAGHTCARVPVTNDWCDHLVEQQFPTSLWGTQFAVTKAVGQQGNQVMVTAQTNNTLVHVNGVQVAVLQALQTYAFRLTDNSAFVTSSEPVSCNLYIEGARNNNLHGDPSSVTILPTEQSTREITFSTFQTYSSQTHYANIVTTRDGASSMRLDGVSVADAFVPLNGSNTWLYARLPVAHGLHTLRTTKDGFVGYLYGMGHAESYAYAIGSSIYIQDHTTNGVGGTPYLEMEVSDVQCYKKAVTFTGYTNIDYTSVLWDFGDGSTANSLTASHTYASPGAYTVRFTVIKDDYRPTTTQMIVVSDMYRDTIHAELCEGEHYSINGQTYSTTGLYTVQQSSSAACDSLVILDLKVHPVYRTEEHATFPKGSSYRWHDHRYRTAGHYYDTLTTVHGCDSITELYLTETDALVELYDTICWQPTYRFRSHDYPLPPVDGYEDRDFINYTLCYRNKSNCTAYRMHLAIVPREGGEYTVYDTISDGQTYTWFGETYAVEGTYRKVLGDNNCMQNYTLHLTVLPFPIQVIDTAFCHGDTIRWNEHFYTEPGTYQDTLFSQVGIEGIYQLNISDRRVFTRLTASVNDDSYLFDGHLLTESGTYRYTYLSSDGCDSVVTLHLGLQEPCTIHTDEYLALCDEETVIWHEQPCSPGNEYHTSYLSVEGCDSIVTLHVTALEKKQMNLSVGLCPGDYYLMGAERLTEEGTYVYHLTSRKGCDSTVTLQLYYTPSYLDTLNTFTRVNEPYSWQGTQYTETGVYTVGLVASNGCDSVKVLQLDVLPACPMDNTEHLYDTITAGLTYPFEDALYTEQGVYTHTLIGQYNCDSIRILHLTVNNLHLHSVASSDSCANNGVLTLEVDYTGLVQSVRVHFDDASREAGWRDTLMEMPPDGLIRLPITARAGHYSVTVELLFRGEVAASYTLPVTLLYPSSVLEQAWNDVVVVLTHDYNGGYDFTAFQWYEDGQALAGETGSYLYRPLTMGAAYSALLTETDGTQMMTCPLIARPQQDISLYPTVVQPRQMIHCTATTEGLVTVYNALGVLVLRTELTAGDNLFAAPETTGLYIAKIHLNDSKNDKTYKLIIR